VLATDPLCIPRLLQTTKTILPAGTQLHRLVPPPSGMDEFYKLILFSTRYLGQFQVACASFSIQELATIIEYGNPKVAIGDPPIKREMRETDRHAQMLFAPDGAYVSEWWDKYDDTTKPALVIPAAFVLLTVLYDLIEAGYFRR
jgi:hypothetical protein